MNTASRLRRLEIPDLLDSRAHLDKRFLRRLFVRAQRTGLSIAAAIFACGHSRAQGPEIMYTLDVSNFAKVHSLDPQTGAILRTVLLSSTPVTQTGLTWDGSRLLLKGNTNWLMDRLIKSNPADGGTVHLSSVGSPWYLNSLEVDPTSGVVRVIAWDRFTNTELFISSMDPLSGALTLGPKIVPPGNWISMAIDSAGRVVLARGSGQAFFFLDPMTGATTLIGSTSVPNSLCFDLAYDSADRLWGSYGDGFNGANTGIYQIDLATLSTIRLVPLSSPHLGLAFGRETATQNYCAGKTSSLNCNPTLDAEGIASPTAKFGFTIRATSLNNNRVGLLLYSANGRASTPFQGGLLCLATPVSRSPAGQTGGSPPPALNCTGSWSIDYNEVIWNRFPHSPFGQAAVTPSPFLVPGTAVQCQWWGRDPGFPAPFNSMLSDGLEFALSP